MEEQHPDHKTYIPGVGFLLTSWDGSECGIFPTSAETGISKGEKEWENFLNKVVAEIFEGAELDDLSDDEMFIAYDVFAVDGTVEQAIGKIMDAAAQEVVDYFENKEVS